jgi:hypothetical protein
MKGEITIKLKKNLIWTHSSYTGFEDDKKSPAQKLHEDGSVLAAIGHRVPPSSEILNSVRYYLIHTISTYLSLLHIP